MNNSLSLFRSLSTSEPMDSPLSLTNNTIQDWKTDRVREDYKDKPFGLNYKLLELAEKEDPEGIPAKIKMVVDRLKLGSEDYQDISLLTLSKKYLKGGDDDPVENFEEFNSKVEEHQAVASMFIDENEKRNKFLDQKDENLSTNIGQKKRLQEIYDGNEFYIINVDGLTLYVKCTIPDTYDSNFAIDIIYTDGAIKKKISIGLSRVQTLSHALKNYEYALRTTSSVLIADAFGSSRVSRWEEGDTDRAIRRLDADIAYVTRAMERDKLRIEKIRKTNSNDPEIESVTQKNITMSEAIANAERQRDDLIKQQQQLGESQQPQLTEGQ